MAVPRIGTSSNTGIATRIALARAIDCWMRKGCATWMTPSMVSRPYTRQGSPSKTKSAYPAFGRLMTGSPGRET